MSTAFDDASSSMMRYANSIESVDWSPRQLNRGGLQFIDLFAGCGGLSLGLSAAGFHCAMAIEAHRDAFETYRTNLIDTGLAGRCWPRWLDLAPTDIIELVTEYSKHLLELRGQIALIAGGPPCQGFTINGRRRADDPRNQMVESYFDVVAQIQPPLVLIENVRGFVSMPHTSDGTYAGVVRRRLLELDYEVWDDILLASDWGVPQSRPRYFCIAAKGGLASQVHPFDELRARRKHFLASRGLWPSPTTVQDALSDIVLGSSDDPDWGHLGFQAVERSRRSRTPYQQLMRRNSSGQPTDRRVARHSPATRTRFRNILATCPRGVGLRPSDRARLGIGKRSTTPLDGDRPSPTLTTLPDDFVHYCDPRTMSVREHARLQSFPDWFAFRGPYTSGGLRRRNACPRYTQVGNAVPPLLAEAIGEMLSDLLDDQLS